MKKVRSFTDLDAWKIAHEFVLTIYAITKEFPTREQFGITDQLRRASVSISSNIAEGFSRKTTKEKQQFYRTALSSLTEVQNQLLICRDVGYMSKDIFQETATKSVRVSKLIHGLMKSASTHATKIRNTKYAIPNTK